MKEDLLLGYVTCPNLEVARSIARQVIETGLVACVNVMRGVETYYQWNGEMCEDPEVILLSTMVKAHWQAFEELVSKLHPYECPAIFALPIDPHTEPFGQWVSNQSMGLASYGSGHKAH